MPDASRRTHMSEMMIMNILLILTIVVLDVEVWHNIGKGGKHGRKDT
jgi:hypothetical protein